MYNGKCTSLGLVATSTPSFAAGVQRDVMDVLLKHGARMDRRGSVGHDSLLVRGCLANGQPQAAESDLQIIDKTWKTPPLVWALTGSKRSGHSGQYYEVVGELVGAGAEVTTDLIEKQSDAKMRSVLGVAPPSR